MHQQIQVVDTAPPSIALTASPAILLHRNHQLVHITLTTAASDVCDAAPLVACVATSNAPAEGHHGEHGDEDRNGKDVVWRNGQLYLRAKSNPHGKERVYTITCKATGASGNSSSAVALVKVPGERDDRENDEDDGDRR